MSESIDGAMQGAVQLGLTTLARTAETLARHVEQERREREHEARVRAAELERAAGRMRPVTEAVEGVQARRGEDLVRELRQVSQPAWWDQAEMDRMTPIEEMYARLSQQQSPQGEKMRVEFDKAVRDRYGLTAVPTDGQWSLVAVADTSRLLSEEERSRLQEAAHKRIEAERLVATADASDAFAAARAADADRRAAQKVVAEAEWDRDDSSGVSEADRRWFEATVAADQAAAEVAWDSAERRTEQYREVAAKDERQAQILTVADEANSMPAGSVLSRKLSKKAVPRPQKSPLQQQQQREQGRY